MGRTRIVVMLGALMLWGTTSSPAHASDADDTTVGLFLEYDTGSQPLDTGRVVSSIPRSSSPGPSSCPVNHEVETGSDGASGNWIYPSEKMFFEAMRRKGHESARVADMKTVVPIHNAVNERAWAEIKTWEAPYNGSGKGQ